MVLRDFFTQLGDIYDFHFEKNRNGSYRVNTVIKELIYDDLYTPSDFNESQIGYFLANDDLSYQNYPNIRNSFSELMNPKDNSNRFPVLEFADSIDIGKMYLYYNTLTNNLEHEKQDALCNFIDKVFEDDVILHARLRVICTSDYEYIVWIILNGMFNSQTFDSMLQKFVAEKKPSFEPVSISESSFKHRISLFLSKKNSHIRLYTGILVFLLIVEFILALAPNFIPKYNSISTTEQSIYSIIILIYSSLTTLFWLFQTSYSLNYAELRTMYMYIDDYSEKDFDNYSENSFIKRIMTPIFKSKSKVDKSRDSLRHAGMVLVVISCALALIPSFIFQSFPILIGLWVMVCLICMLIDRITNDKRYREYYDMLTSPKGTKPSEFRGLAKIYRWEYEKTGLNLNDNYYKDTIPLHCNVCYKNIFSMAYDRNKWSLMNQHLILFFLNLFLVIFVIFNYLIGSKGRFFRIPDNVDVNIFVLIYILSAGIFSIIVAITNSSKMHGIALLAHSIIHIGNHPQDAEKIYTTLQCDNYIKEVDEARGIYLYNMAIFNNGGVIEDILPESDRMLFAHRKSTLNAFLGITVCMLYVIVIMFFVWHTRQYRLFFPVTAAFILIYFFAILYIPKRVSKKKIIKEIKKLSEV